MTSRIDGESVKKHHQAIDTYAKGPRLAAWPYSNARHVVRVVEHRLLVTAFLTCHLRPGKRAAWSSGSLSSEKAVRQLAPGQEELEAIGQKTDPHRWQRDQRRYFRPEYACTKVGVEQSVLDCLLEGSPSAASPAPSC